MKHKTYLRVALTLTLTLMLTLTCGAATSAYAFTDENAADTTPTPPAVTEPAPAPAKPVELTPDGQLTLVDDISGDAAAGKQFLTIITKGGNYFYIVIDRVGDTENVHFLNLVDESDLLALIKDETTTTPAVTTPAPVETAPAEPKPAPEPEPEQGGNLSLILGIIVLLALAGGGAAFYIKVLKPKRSGRSASVPSDLDEFDFEDDDFDELGDGFDIAEPDEQTKPYSYEDYEAKEDEQ